MNNAANPQEWVSALQGLIALVPWAAGVLGLVFVVKYAVVPLIRAFRGTRDE